MKPGPGTNKVPSVTFCSHPRRCTPTTRQRAGRLRTPRGRPVNATPACGSRCHTRIQAAAVDLPPVFPHRSAMSPIKQHAHQLIDALPEAAGWDDLARAVDGAGFEAAVHAGMAAADQGQIASPAQVTAMFARWGVDVAA